MRRTRFERGARALVVGGGGGLGRAIMKLLLERGFRVSAALRNPKALGEAARSLEAVFEVDLESGESISSLMEGSSRLGLPDFVVNAAGYDVRKSLLAHSLEEIDRSLSVDLRAPILLTRAFLPAMLARGSGTMIHLGGFADGRLALPYYSADVAARGGLRSFVESMNREIGGRGPRIIFFGPAVADTDAERPFHHIWKGLGVRPVSSEAVAKAILEAGERGREVSVMGAASRGFGLVNALSPRLADRLLLRGYSKALAESFGGP